MQVDSITGTGVAGGTSGATGGQIMPHAVRPVEPVSSRPTGTLTPGQPAAPWTDSHPPQQIRTVLTAEMMRDELLNMGIQPTRDAIAVAQSLAKLGLPLTPQTMAEAHASLAAAGNGALPPSYALAKVLNLPASPGVLRGLSSVMAATSTSTAVSGTLFSLLQPVLPAALVQQMARPVDAVMDVAEVTARRELPRELLQRLGLTVDFEATPAEIATKMQAYSRQILRSTESRISQALTQEGALDELSDVRVLLLRLASDSPDKEIREGAAALASHIEGQQLVNIGAAHSRAHQPDGQQIAYVAIPLAFAGEQSLVELRLWPKEPEEDDSLASWTDEDPYPVRATLRMTLSHLGRVQAHILGDYTGYLHCRLSAEKPGVLQLISRNSGQLTDVLAKAGWARNEIAFDSHADWSPLWTGGEALVKPRQRIDWRA